MKETQTGNRVARGFARITNLAIIFTPMSAIAAIFSMSGQFAQGESYGWVFWAICCPVLLLFSILFLSQDIKTLVQSIAKAMGFFVGELSRRKEKRQPRASTAKIGRAHV